MIFHTGLRVGPVVENSVGIIFLTYFLKNVVFLSSDHRLASKYSLMPQVLPMRRWLKKGTILWSPTILIRVGNPINQKICNNRYKKNSVIKRESKAW